MENLPEFKNPVLTIGSFDGVHRGHRAIINRIIEKAKEVSGESVILTFEPHPRQVVFPNDESLRLLTTLEEKIRLLASTGIQHLIIIPFTIEFSQINPYVYVDQVLIDKISVKHLIIGYDHRFGLNREGNIDLLNLYARQEKFTVEEIPRQDIDDLRISSTKIRNHLLEGNIEIANRMLQATYIISGQVSKGSKIASRLGFPTANCEVVNRFKLIPKSGTYAARVECDGSLYHGMLYIGKSPTLKSTEKDIIEMNIFADLEEPLYGKEIQIFPEVKIRNDQKFIDVQELLFNIESDKNEVEHYFLKQPGQSAVTSAVLNYNGETFLEEYVASNFKVENQEVVVIDNDSTDNSCSIMKEKFPQAKIIELESNFGFAKGYNMGVAEIGSKYLALVNSDIIVTPDWLDPIIARMEEDETIGAIQPKIKSADQREYFEYAGACGGFLDRLGYPLCRGRVLDYVEEDNGQYNDEQEVFWASGAAFVTRTELFKAAGGFDQEFFAHMEEIDYCWRIKNAGYKILCLPESVVYHLGGGTLAYDAPHKVFLNLRNNYWMLFKNSGISGLFMLTPLRIALDIAYSMSFLAKGKLTHFTSALKGVFAGLSGIFRTSSKRRRIRFFQNRYSIGPPRPTGRKKAILPFAYYLFRKKRFSELK